MTIIELHTLCQPLINFLGTICLVVLAAAGTLSVVIWIAKRIWKFVLAAGAMAALAAVILLCFGAA